MDDWDAQVNPTDRLSFTLFVAAALHGLLILGVGFSLPDQPSLPPTFEVTLATHQSREAPDQADYQAQLNQEASGTLEEAKELTTDTVAPFSDTQIREVSPVPEIRAAKPQETAQLAYLETQSLSQERISDQEDPEDNITEEALDGQELDTPLVSAEIASLRAKLDRQQQAYARRPRTRRLTSVATTAARDAAYLNSWRQKIERVGNENFPQQALQDKIFGQLRLAAIIRANGTIVSVDLLQSSGYSILDNAALQIVHLAAPFEPFPPEIAKNTDRLEIIRTWRFEITGLSTN